MKGLNIKRIVALGIGAALIGSALAPVVSAATLNNLNTLEKTDVVSSAGVPVVDVVVGGNAAISDVVWAGNIAARVAQLATKPATGECGAGAIANATVDVTVGGTTTTMGSGETAEGYADFAAQEGALNAITVTNSQMPTLINNPSAKVKWNSTSYSTAAVSEDLNAVIDVDFQGVNTSSNYAVGELYGSVAKGNIFYNVNIGALDISADKTNMDSNSYYDVQIPFLGKVYVLDEIDASEQRLVLYADTTPIDLLVGETVDIQSPSTAYAGKDLTVKLVDLVQTGSGTLNNSYEAKWALMVDGVAVKYVQKAPSTTYNLKDEFGTGYFTDNVYVTAAGLNLAANTYTATIRTGSDRLELRNGRGFPYTGDNTVDADQAWEVNFEGGTTVTKISLKNQWKYDKTNGNETDTSKYVLKVGESISLPNDFATFTFNGFQTKPSTEVLVGEVSEINNGGIQYRDLKGTKVNVPVYIPFDLDFNQPRVATIGAQDYTFWIDANSTADSNSGFSAFYIKGDYSSAETRTGATWIELNGLQYNAVTLAGDADTNLPAAVAVDLGTKSASGAVVDTNYLLVADASSESAALVLGANTFNIYNKSKSATAPKLVFNDTNNNNAAGVTYYYPNTQEFIETLMGGTYDSAKYMASHLTYTDNNNDTTVALYLRTGDSASVWNYEAIRNETNASLYGPTKDAVYSHWTDAIRDGSDYLLAGYTEDGTMVESDNSVFTLTVPEESRLVEAYLGSTDASTSVVGGETITVADGETETTLGGTTITVAVDGTCGAAGSVDAVDVVKVSNLVKVAGSFNGGKHIIVGGFVANTAAIDLQVSEGNTLEDMLVNDGDYVAAVLGSGDIVAAGFNATDTGTAASALITALEGLM